MIKHKEIQEWIITILLLILFTGCKPGTNDSKKPDTVIDSNKLQKDNNKPKEESKKEPTIVDSGQVWFKVNITKNDTSYINYEGNWPRLFMSNNSANIQLSASKNAMGITNMLTIYMHGLPTGKLPIVLSGRDTDKVSMVMSQVINGNYDIPILPDEGFLNITKNTGKVLSGSFEAKAVDANKDNFLLTGTFLNVTVKEF